ncbi:DUF2381 family protein [Corallococcus sicarius]|uniref:DUF2381 family protein n=1 Tax=Corallococcus sicarius TaxID=2316726 RepID=A0A3A8NJS2_9BACT|nr:DUF2381 family protein [Corallococcus sicarius]RKH43610.1 DUF2381 family protein [Corallococcus sicarius]
MTTSVADRLQKAALFALLLMSVSAEAQEPPCPSSLSESPRPKSVYLSKNPKEEATELYVAGGVATTLRFPTASDPTRTKLLGWEGRFEPLLVGGRSVVVVPLRDLAPEDRFILLVTLLDGTEIPFTVTSAKPQVDSQVDVYPDPEAPDAVRQALAEKRKEVRTLRAENHQKREEETSVEHALAALLAQNEIAMTPFKEAQKWLQIENEIEIAVSVLVPKGKVAQRKVAVVFTMKNKDPVRPWTLQAARLSTWTTRESRPFALRMTPSAIAPGSTGRIAMVTDLASFDSNRDGDRLVVEIFRDGGLRQAYVELMPQERR